MEQKRKEEFLTALATAIKDLRMPIRKHANELKVHKKTARTAIKKDLGPNVNPFD